MTDPEVLRFAAFTDDAAGGNPAGVVLADELPPEHTMQRIAADVGYSETAFLAREAPTRWRVRFFSPAAEVSFCGHATVAAAVVLARADPTLDRLAVVTNVGDVPVRIERGASGIRAILTSVKPTTRTVGSDWVDELLGFFGWDADVLDPSMPVRIASAGADHAIVALAEVEQLRAMRYDFDELRTWMELHGLTTVAIVHRAGPSELLVRNAFPVGGVVEDPATGAAAAALGGYLRELGLVTAPAQLVIHQGHDMGRPSRIDVTVPAAGGIEVAGGAVPI